jgi:SAM-dependent methyltransferase
MQYTLTPRRVIEKLRQAYFKPLAQRDRQNRFEPLDMAQVEERLTRWGIALEPYRVNWHGFEEFQRQHAGQFGRWNGKIEKQLEYFISRDLLDIQPDDCLIDIGSWYSPYPDLIRREYGCTVYAQDLSYGQGIHGWQIGGDAAALPLTDGSVSKMALHCTFEHFEGDTDTRFVREVSRVLAPGGRVVIVPLYIHQDYTIWSDPSLFASSRIQPDSGAKVYLNVGWSNQFGRHYSPEALRDRIARQAGGLSFKVLQIANVPDLDPRCYVRFIGLLDKKVHDSISGAAHNSHKGTQP